MPRVSDVLARKGRGLVSLPSTASVLEAARLMNERGVGAVLVVDGGALVGIFTERDILRRIVVPRQDAAATTVREVMTADVVTCDAETTLEECASVMTSRRIRHLPVADKSGPCGMISIGDLLAHQVAEQESTITDLNRYIHDIR